MAVVIPVAKSVFLADEVLFDVKKQKLQLINIFNAARPPSGQGYPFVLGQICVFSQLTDGEGKVPTTIRVVDSTQEQTTLYSQVYTLQFPTRLTIVNACFRLQRFLFPEPGKYCVELFCGNEFVDDRVLTLHPA